MNSYLNYNLHEIQKNIIKACAKVGRNPKEITLLGVTKTVDVQKINDAINLGVVNIGENRVQELISKYDFVDKRANWHFIGNLQTNKVKYIIDKVSLIHSVDSLKLASEIDKRAKIIGKKTDILIEVNIAKESSKFGVFPEEVQDFVQEILNFRNLRVKGLMTVAPFVEKSEENREYFKNMKKIFIDINNKNKDNISMKYISMGMSNDYEIAIEEGSNFIRIGTSLFGIRN